VKIKLKALDMSLSDRHNHPQVNCKRNYLCKIGGQYFAGKFSREWFGLVFDHWIYNSLQFDAPGTNGSKWEQIWEIVKL
jgi:hypothetical protein